MKRITLQEITCGAVLLTAATLLSACATATVAPTATTPPTTAPASATTESEMATATEAPAMNATIPSAIVGGGEEGGGEGVGENGGQVGGEGGGEGRGAATVTVSSTGALVDSSGMTLYTLDGDTADTSTCTGGCVSHWPPLVVLSGQTPTAGNGASGTLSTLTRDDGTVQVTYDGHPLYTYTGDNAPGDENGDGANGGVWHVARP